MCIRDRLWSERSHSVGHVLNGRGIAVFLFRSGQKQLGQADFKPGADTGEGVYSGAAQAAFHMAEKGRVHAAFQCKFFQAHSPVRAQLADAGAHLPCNCFAFCHGPLPWL